MMLISVLSLLSFSSYADNSDLLPQGINLEKGHCYSNDKLSKKQIYLCKNDKDEVVKVKYSKLTPQQRKEVNTIVLMQIGDSIRKK